MNVFYELVLLCFISPQGVAHKCICPSWADTEIVSGAKTTEEERDGLKQSIKVRN